MNKKYVAMGELIVWLKCKNVNKKEMIGCNKLCFEVSFGCTTSKFDDLEAAIEECIGYQAVYGTVTKFEGFENMFMINV